ncbi:MAG TPA: helix-turn-helix transcriptional regulator [Dehalococcoidia bacterium]|nr:helix-turn-helix transcriptional regulator [Dehalococcoidia bacterium]
MSQEQGITPRQEQVLDLLVDGASDKQIGRALGISARTVETHVRTLRLKTGTPNRAALAAWWAVRRESSDRQDLASP